MRSAALILVIAASSPCQAAPSGLTLIPTGDVLGVGEACVEYQVDGPLPMGSGPDASLINTQFGVGNRAEAGLDFDFSAEAETGVIANGKLVIRPLEDGIGMCLGVYGVGENLSPGSYAVATLPCGRVRLHAGVQWAPEETQGFGAVDYTVSDAVQLWAEYLAGNEGAWAVSLAYQLSCTWGISVGLQRPNAPEAHDTYSLHLGCVLPTE